jgi:hypothetical protein
MDSLTRLDLFVQRTNIHTYRSSSLSFYNSNNKNHGYLEEVKHAMFWEIVLAESDTFIHVLIPVVLDTTLCRFSVHHRLSFPPQCLSPFSRTLYLQPHILINTQYLPHPRLMSRPITCTYPPRSRNTTTSRISIKSTTILHPNLQQARTEYLRDSSLRRSKDEVDDELMHAKMLFELRISMEVSTYILYKIHNIVGRLMCTVLRETHMRVLGVPALTGWELEWSVV